MTGRLFHAYADVHATDAARDAARRPSDDRRHAGRRLLRRAARGDEGARPGARPLPAYGGVPVQTTRRPPANRCSGSFGDAAVGGRPVRADWLHLRTKASRSPRRRPLSGSAAAELGKTLRFDLSTRGSSPRRATCGFAHVLRAGLRPRPARPSWYRLPETQGDLAVPFDLYFATLHELFLTMQVGPSPRRASEATSTCRPGSTSGASRTRATSARSTTSSTAFRDDGHPGRPAHVHRPLR